MAGLTLIIRHRPTHCGRPKPLQKQTIKGGDCETPDAVGRQREAPTIGEGQNHGKTSNTEGETPDAVSRRQRAATHWGRQKP